MSKTKRDRKPLAATSVRMALIGVLAFVLLAMSGGFYLAYSALKKTAAGVSEVQSQAVSADAELRRLVQLKDDMGTYADVVDKTQNIVSESNKYMYQNQIIKDMTAMADSANVNITVFDFGSSAEDGAASTDTSTPPPVTETTQPIDGAETPSETKAPETPAPAIKSTFVSISMSNVAYENLLRFIYLIENNVSRMQISQLTLSPGSNGTVSVDALEVEVYIR